MGHGFSVVACAIGAALAGGCSTQPLPDNLPVGYSTIQIVAKIRCEIRDALRAEFGAAPVAVWLRVPELEAGTPLARSSLPTAYDQAAIAYEFTFDIKEQNKADAGLGLTDPFSNGLFALGFSASNDATRKNVRNFRIKDTFGNLRTKISDKYCNEVSAGKNWQYPIVGKIGLAEILKTFVDLNDSVVLVGEKDLVPVLADTLEFETTITGSINPVLALSSPGGGNVANRIRLGGASATLTAMRKDLHTLVVALSLPVKEEKAAPPRAAGRPVARSGTGAERRAVDELDRQQDKVLNRKLQRLITD